MVNTDMVDPRNIVERACFRASESIALQREAEEIGISKSTLIRLAVLQFLRARHESKQCHDAGLTTMADQG